MKMRILCTGSSGYIGSVLCPMLAEKHYVQSYDITQLRNICDEATLKPAIDDCDAIIHLAAISTPKKCDARPELAQQVNVEAIKLINHLRGNKPLFYPNTNIGYGTTVKQDIYDETSPMHPNSVYGKTKLEAENLILTHGDCVVFRLASLFGYSPAMSWNLLLNFMVKEAFTKGILEIYEPHVRRNFLHVIDICRAFMHAIENYEGMRNEVYNVGLAYHPTKMDVAHVIKDHLPDTRIEEIKGSDPDARDYIIANQKIMATGWTPRFTMERGISELVEVLHG